jgi:hypothetical protein
MLGRVLIGFIVVCVLFLSGCSDSPPSIVRISWKVILFNNRETTYGYQKLSLFVQITDEDGVKDIGSLYLINDDKELFWGVDKESWQMITKGSETWIGTNAITMPGGEPFPTGKYRVYLEDLSGQSDETSIYINNDNVATSQTTTPESYTTGDTIYVRGSYDNYELWVYDKSNHFIAAFPVDEQGIKTEVIANRQPELNNAFTYYVYCPAKNNAFGILTGPYFYTNTTDKNQ